MSEESNLTVKMLEKMATDARHGLLQEAIVVGIFFTGEVGSGHTPTISLSRRLEAIEHIKLRWINSEGKTMKKYEPSEKVLSQIDNAFTYHSPKDDQAERYTKLRSHAKYLAVMIAENTPPSREQSLALRKLEEAVMFANSAIARNEGSLPEVTVLVNGKGFQIPASKLTFTQVTDMAEAWNKDEIYCGGDKMNELQIEITATMCHQANREWCIANEDDSQPHWHDAPDWQRDSAVLGVRFHLDNPDAGTSDSHDSWMKQKLDEGWVYGETKDPAAKTHPCIVPYEELPIEQRMKDFLFRGIVHAMRDGYKS